MNHITILHTSTNVKVLSFGEDLGEVNGDAVFSARAILGINPFIDDDNKPKSAFNNQQVQISNSIKIYPNPANDKLYIQLDNTLDGIAKVEFYDLAGKLIYSTTINASLKLQMLNISNLTKGIYNLRITANNKTKNQKLVIIK